MNVGVEEIFPEDSSSNELTESPNIGSNQEKLAAIAQVKYIVGVRPGEEEGMINFLGL